MARVSDIIRGLEILQRYAKDKAHIGGADHDVIYGPSLERPLSKDSEAELTSFGWFVDEDSDLWSHFC